ncbi:P-loop containing nucleoside triphosphate hydrolase protein [Syncephalastrum racemosum]|uniref:P-loop containing nucleoside triphosphate hydrolase protein n=1 Tax=Syncephalastrum racemosum TaxID=13706 RepID=A0A1X2H3I2_SYNRA|nr:P-loop containing nucleoside triphosphate hydrolase protein [Syncephalastrum racemosum]
MNNQDDPSGEALTHRSNGGSHSVAASPKPGQPAQGASTTIKVHPFFAKKQSSTLIPARQTPVPAMWPDVALFEGGHIEAKPFGEPVDRPSRPRAHLGKRVSLRDQATPPPQKRRRAFAKRDYPKEPVYMPDKDAIGSIYGCAFDIQARSGQHLLWTEKYRPSTISGLLGDAGTNAYLRDWLQLMKVAMTPVKRKKQKTRNIRDDDVIYEEDPLLNILLVAGPPGVGKTAAVYTAAEETHYSVFEIHPGMRRSGRDLMAYVGEMAKSHMVDGQRQTSESGVRQSVILLEHADVLFEEDKGFWTAVVELAQKSKRPIVMTCNDRELIPLETLKLQGTLLYHPVDPIQVMAYLHGICSAEGICVAPADLAGIIAAVREGDLRQLILTIQLWCDKAQHNNTGLFEKYMAIPSRRYQSDPDDDDMNVTQILELDQAPTHVELGQFYRRCILRDTENEHTSLEVLVHQLEDAGFVDAHVDPSAERYGQVKKKSWGG